MTRTRAVLIFLVVAASATFAATAAGAADAGHGEVIATRWCAACHAVSPSQTQASTQSPPFSEIARKPTFDAAQLALYLLLPHPRMPDMGMSRDEAADLAAYIAAQR
ncbi:MAG: cytochrome c [Pseudolabrys sp.]